MSSITSGGMGDPVESEIIDVMRKKDYSLGTVNNYGDNLLHMSAANGCYTVIKEILKKTHDNRDINSQNYCGWTPLMQAIRNGNVETVKLLLANGYTPDQLTFQGISAIALSVAMGREMFEIVYEACPSALESTKNDNISPLCVAAMKNDKELFFRLLELGVKVSDAGDYTLLMMGQSNVQEIAKLGESHHKTNNYWQNDSSFDNYEHFSDDDFDVPQMSSTLQGNENSMDRESHSGNQNSDVPSICLSPPDDTTNIAARKNSAPQITNFANKFASKSLISPRLEYTRERALPVSPNLCFARRENGNDSGFGMEFKINRDEIDKEENRDVIDSLKNSVISNENKMYRFQLKRPPNLQIPNDEDNKKFKDKSAPMTANKTPMEPRYDTPPRELALDMHQTKMAFLLKRFGLTHFIPTFLEQEVDVGLFLSLNEQDLQEIGIEKKSDRIILQSVIDECNRNKIFL